MSDIAAAAAALGLPEALVRRSAEARAAETGMSVDEIIAAWGGGGSVPAPAAAPTETPAETPETSDGSATPTPPSSSAIVDEVATPTSGGTELAPPVVDVPTPAPAGPYKPPILVGAADNPLKVLAGVVALFLIVLLVGLIGPSLPIDIPGARSSDIAFSDQALDGQQVYLKFGCASCHTQVVRPVVADVGLGPVSLNDTNLVLGTRRFGPDLANIGARSDDAYIQGMVQGAFGHPKHNLSSGDMSALISYLSESSTTRDE